MGSWGLGIAGDVLSWNLLTWEGPPGSTRTAVYWVNVWSNHFGSDCDGSECMYEFFVGNTLLHFRSVLTRPGCCASCTKSKPCRESS
jgi:hypothetical protein